MSCFRKFLLLSLLSLISCSTSPEKKGPTRIEKSRFEQKIGDKLAEIFDPTLEFETDVILLKYLTSTAERLFKSVVEEGNIFLTVKVVKNQKKPYWNTSLPGNKIYLSLQLLQTYKYENQLAASIAIEVARVLKGIVLRKMYGTHSEFYRTDQVIDYEKVIFSKESGALVWTHAENVEVVQYAVEILYSAGYDPRGLIHYFQNLQTLGSYSLYSYEELEKLKSIAQKEIVKIPPLLNPIVRSNEFYKIRKRIQNL